MSDVFKDMLGTQEGEQKEIEGGLPVVRQSEAGEDVGLLLRCCLSPEQATWIPPHCQSDREVRLQYLSILADVSS